ncbi:MAG: alpha/beta hydrolase, partial [Planctomycetota bacterium]
TRPGGVRVRDVAIERPLDALASGAPLGIRVYEPPPQAGTSSGVILYFHGGGFALGDLDSHDTIVADLSAATGLTAVAVDYARVPEHQFPAALQDARTAWLWLTSNTGEITIDPHRIILAGDSCGATLAANLALSAHHPSDQFNPAGQVLIYPVLGADFETSSYRANANAPNLTRAEMIACWDAYLPLSRREEVAKLAIPNRSEVPATLAPAAILTAAHDPVWDDGAVYATRLGGNGIATAYRCDADLPHGHLRARREDPSAQRAFAWICQATRQLINGVRCGE